MSTDYCLAKKVPFDGLFDGRLEDFGVREHVAHDTTTKERCLTDGRNFVWVVSDDDGFVCCLSRYGANAPAKILNAMAVVFDTDVVSEYEPHFWGFDTQEEWNAYNEQISREHDEEFHVELLKYVGGEPHEIRPGTIGMRYAEIAKTLVDKDPSLSAPINRDRFLKEIRSTYDRDDTMTVTLSPQDLALAKMIATHEDDLPS